MISFKEKKSAAPEKTLPFYTDDAVKVLIKNFERKINFTSIRTRTWLHAGARSFMVTVSIIE